MENDRFQFLFQGLGGVGGQIPAAEESQQNGQQRAESEDEASAKALDQTVEQQPQNHQVQ